MILTHRAMKDTTIVSRARNLAREQWPKIQDALAEARILGLPDSDEPEPQPGCAPVKPEVADGRSPADQ